MGQHGMRVGTVSSLDPIPGTSGASGKRSLLRCAAPGAAGGGTTIPFGLAQALCIALARCGGDYAAIKACFAPGPMFASVPGLFAFVWGGWGAGR